MRRTRAEVLGQLPARTDKTLYVEMADAQRSPYAEQRATLVRLLNKKYLTEVDRRRVLCCLANLRMLCDSTFLYDKQTKVSPKLAELAELLPELMGEGMHKVVIFSQWETMIRQAAEVLERSGIGYALLHGGIPGRERKALLDRFRNDPACRVFLSTDAGGTGLNLQAADTVINLEVPWNPAVLEQRVARVHRMGQQKPVQIFHLVTRDSIEERVLRTIEQKRSLFEGVFEGTTDEVDFAVLGRPAFLETVRELAGAEEEQATNEENAATVDPREALARAGVQFVEALAGYLGQPANGHPSLVTTDARTGSPLLQLPLPSPEVLRRGAAVLEPLASQLAQRRESTDEPAN